MPERAPLRVFEEQTAEAPVTKSWERQEGEPARWFLRFRNYVQLGARRSVNAVFELERQEKSGKVSNKAGSRWYGVARYWQWEARAAAYDAEVERQSAAAMRDIAANMPFVSRPYRLVQLNTLAAALMSKIEAGMEVTDFLASARMLQSLMHDITEEVTAGGYSLDQTADSAALLTFARKHLRLEDLL